MEILLAIACVYLLPTIVAFSVGHVGKWGILVSNILLGWTFFFWAVTLITALNGNTQSRRINVRIVRD